VKLKWLLFVASSLLGYMQKESPVFRLGLIFGSPSWTRTNDKRINHAVGVTLPDLAAIQKTPDSSAFDLALLSHGTTSGQMLFAPH